MLAFIVTLRSPRYCVDWRRLSQLCERTVRSICNQTSPAFRVVVVCHERPAMDFDHPAFEIIAEPSLPIPTSIAEGRRDKWQKIRIGLTAQRQAAPLHVMIADADDCVSRRLAALVAEQPLHSGWFFNSGYVHDEGSTSVFRHQPRFDLICGTSAIVRCAADDLPTDMAAPVSKYSLLAFGHTKIQEHMAAIGRPLSPVPFPGAIYVRGTGENINAFTLRGWRSRKVMLRKLLWTRRLTPRLRQEYGLYPLSLHKA